MKTLRLTPEQMRSRIFRFNERKAHVNHTADSTLPPEVFEALNPPLYLLLASATAEVNESSRPAIIGAKGLSVAIFELAPGQKVPLHVHLRSQEAYVCLKGRIKVRWNDHGEDEALLEPFDMIDVPVGLYRDFQATDDGPALLLGIMTDPREDDPDDIFISPDEKARFAARFGGEIFDELTAATGIQFAEPSE